jgi:dienelactone hydrolase
VAAPHRGLVVVPDIMGCRPLFDDLCARLAAEHGWAVRAVEPFPGQEGMPLDERLATGVAALDDARLLGDVGAAADQLGADRTAVMGFCMGGMYALKAAGTGRFDRAVSFYGMIRVPAQFQGPGQGQPLDALAARRPGQCPVLAVLGGRDHWTPPDDVAALRALPDVEVVVYPEADHGFVHDRARPAHRPDDAADAWRRVAAFLA